MVPGLLAGLTILAVITMLWARQHHGSIPVLLPTAVASTGFVLTALARGALRHTAGRCILLALAFCWAGDIVGPSDFMLGAGAFLVGHLALMAAFLQRGVRLHFVAVSAVPVLTSSGILAAWLMPHVPASNLPLIVAYMSVITCMWLLAGGAAHDAAGQLAFIGAAVFYVSDIFVARWRYVDTSSVNAFFCYPLYYVACLIFAWSSGFPNSTIAGSSTGDDSVKNLSDEDSANINP